MAVRNGEPYLTAALDSVLQQTYHDFEFIIVEDASTDDTPQTLAAYGAHDPRLVLLVNPANLGMAASLNGGLALARGRYIARQDADDLSFPTRLQEQVAFLDQHPEVGLLSSHVQIIDEAGRPLVVDPYAGGLDDAALQAELLDHNSFCHGSVMLRRAGLQRVGTYDEGLELTEDYDLWLRLAEVTRLAKLPGRLYAYRQHAGSISIQRRGQQMVAQARTLEKAMHRRYPGNPPSALQRRAADNYRQAADFFVQQGDLAAARQALAHAIRLCPNLFATADTYLPLPPGSGDLAFAESVLAALGPTRPFNRARRLLRARVHMRRVFAAAGRGDVAELKSHLWVGLYQDPRWLLNRGVLSLTARALWGRPWRRMPAAPRPTPTDKHL